MSTLHAAPEIELAARPAPGAPPAKMPSRRGLDLSWLAGPLTLIVVLLVWKGAVVLSGVSRFILPPPEAVFGRIVTLLGEPTTPSHIWTTLYETLAGFAIGTLLGTTLGFGIAKSPALERALNPLIVATQVMPKVALAPLFVLWFGFGPTSKIVIAALLAFFPLLSNVVLGVRSVEASRHDVFNSLAATPWQRFRHLELPATLPYLLTGMEVGVVLSIIGAVVGEYLGGDRGLGYLTVYAQNAFQTETVFAAILMLTVLGFALYWAVASVRRFAIPWHESVIADRREVP